MSLYEFGPFQLDADRLILSQRGVPIAVGPKVVETLLALIEHPGDVFAKAALIERIWPEGYVDEANLAQNVYVLAQDSARPLERRSDRNDSAPRIPFRRAGFPPRRRRAFRTGARAGAREAAALRRVRRSLVSRRYRRFSADDGALARQLAPADAFNGRHAPLRDRPLLLEPSDPRRRKQKRRLLRTRHSDRSARPARLCRAGFGQRHRRRL